jgi:hypothetical protein
MLIGTGIIGVPKQQKTCALRLPLNMTIFHTNYKLYKELSSPSLIVNISGNIRKMKIKQSATSSHL